MVKQSSYALVLQGNLNTRPILVDNAVKVVTRNLVSDFFVMSLKNEFFSKTGIVELMNQAVALIGRDGDLGSDLAYRWAKVGYPILIGSRNLEQSSLTDQQINVRLAIEALEDITILQSVA